MITIVYGKKIMENTYDVLSASDIRVFLKPGMSVSIKPNLVVARPAAGGATTHPEIIEGIIIFLKDNGFKKINIIESSWVGDSTKSAYKNCGYEELSRKHNIPLFDLKSDSSRKLTYGEYAIEICDEALKTDFLINVPVLKGHSQTYMTCCMKNLKGCIPDKEKRRFHSLGIHKPVAALNALLKTGYCVVDGICGDLSFEEGGNPVTADRIIAGQNPLLVDSYCAQLIGYDPDDIEYLTYGRKMGIGEFYGKNTEIRELNSQNKPGCETKSSRIAERYSGVISEDAACSACYSSLIHALYRLGGKTGIKGKIHIGQGFRGKRDVPGFGVGDCTRGFSDNVAGCPPKATDIINALK